VIINGENDTLPRVSDVSAGGSPGLMVLSSDRATLLVYDSFANAVQVVNTKTESSTGSVQMPGPATSPVTSMVILPTDFGYAAVPAAPVNASPAGAVVVMNLETGAIAATINVPSAQTVVASPNGSQLLVFSNDSDVVTVISPLLVNTGVPVTTTFTECTGCRPVYALFSSDGSTAYILNCGAECGGAPAAGAAPSVQTLNLSTLALGTSVPVDGATTALMNGTTLYVAGNSAVNNSCAGQTTAATTCGRLDIVDLASMTVTNSAVITDGYHDRIDISSNGQLFVGSHTCTNIGDVNNPQGGEVRGCLSIFNTTNGDVVIPGDNGDVTGLQSFSSRYVEYVAEGGSLRVYDTTRNTLLINDYIDTGTILIAGQIIDVKAVDFF
jgi:hypothetical protein